MPFSPQVSSFLKPPKVSCQNTFRLVCALPAIWFMPSPDPFLHWGVCYNYLRRCLRSLMDCASRVITPPMSSTHVTQARTHHVHLVRCRKGDPFQSPKLGSCLTLGNELSEETHVLTNQEILLGKGAWAESSRVREPRRTCCHMACRLGFYGDGISFRVVLSQSY